MAHIPSQVHNSLQPFFTHKSNTLHHLPPAHEILIGILWQNPIVRGTVVDKRTPVATTEHKTIRVRPKTYDQIMRLAAERRMSVVVMLQTLVDAWTQLPPNSQEAIIRKPESKPRRQAVTA
jgi:hypothetical protein